MYLLPFCDVHGVENPVKQENLILDQLKKKMREKKFDAAKALWIKNYPRYSSSILFDYWGGKIFLYSPEFDPLKKPKNFRKAIHHLVRVTELFKSGLLVSEKIEEIYLESQYHISLAFFLLNDMDGAIRAMKDVIRVNDRLLPAWFNLAIFYEILGKRSESKIAYKRYLALSSEESSDF